MSHAQPTSNGPADLPALTGARGIAAWIVVLYHIRPGFSASAPDALMAAFGKGYLAVDFFFMLSGFVLWLNYGGRPGMGSGAGVRRFLGRRIARIWPLHAVILAGAVVLALLLDATGRRDSAQFPWGELPLHILLVQNWGFTAALTWNDPAWSISCEWAAYLLFPLLCVGVRGRSVATPVLLGGLVALAVGLHLVMAAGGAQNLGSEISRFGLLRALTEFAMGTMVCAVWRRRRDDAGPAAVGSFGLAAILLAATALGLLPETLGVPLLFAALLLGLALTATFRRNPLSWPVFVYLGELSYATYLAHFLLYIAFKMLFVADPFAVPLPLVAGFLLLTLIASATLYHGVERPAQGALRRMFERERGERVAAPAL